MPIRLTRLATLLAGSLLLSPGSHPAVADAPINFNRDVRPILSETCFRCHGPDSASRAAGLRLDLPESATEDLGGYAAIVPGNAEASEGWQRIISDDPDMVMPPAKSHLVLTDSQKETLRRWIDQGAAYRGHWAFQAPVRSPSTSGPLHRRIDHWVDRGIESLDQPLAANPPADARTLLRRLSYDLTGLPPTAAEVREFETDHAKRGEAAYQDAVNRLLGSRHFGERMATPWLDAARYADTNGYSIDGGRDMWLWRDWVIESINRNQPIDQFIIEQLAGDLLPDATDAQRIATGFNRNHMVTHEGGTIPEENLTNYAADRVKTTSEALLGLTIGCAQCHDHKYDPISQEDYYRFFAFFNELSDKGLDGNAGINPGPRMLAATVLETDELAPLRQRQKRLVEKLSGHSEGFEDWLQQIAQQERRRGENLQVVDLTLHDVTTPNRAGDFHIDDAMWVELPQPSGGINGFTHVLEAPAGLSLTGLRIEFEPFDEDAGDDEPAALTPHDDAVPKLSTVLVSTDSAASPSVNYYREIAFESATTSAAESSHPAGGVLVPTNDDWWQPTDAAMPAHLTLNFETPLDTDDQPFLTALLVFGINGSTPHRWRVAGITGRDDGSNLPPKVAEAVMVPRSEWTVAQSDVVMAYYRDAAPATMAIRQQLSDVRERIGVLTKKYPVMVMDVAKKPRETFILDRGQYDAPGRKVTPAPPAILPPIETDQTGETADRLDLARWMVRDDHPLTARVAVNQLWAVFFGRGLVATEADFGSQGAWPTHPELLDELAISLVQSGWDRKEMIRQIVSSETYRRSSNASPEQLAVDSDNLWLARGPRFRLSAEAIRDTALAVSGLLVDQIGGPSVSPYQPPGLWKEISHFGSTPATRQVFVQDHGQSLYRRSLYTIAKRTSPHPAMVAFDAPNREMCVIRRGVTNTPLQALVTLNDPQFAEASREFALQMMRSAEAPAERIQWGFETVTSRRAGPPELDAINSLYDTMLARYRDDPAAAAAVTSVGEQAVAPEAAPAPWAAWTAVASLLLNLSETLTRG